MLMHAKGRTESSDPYNHQIYRNKVNHEIFLERFFSPHPIHLSMTVPVDGSGLMSNLTPRKSLMCLSVSIP